MTAPRKITCRVLSRVTATRCPNEALTDLGFCAHHLAAAAEEFKHIVETSGRSHEPQQALGGRVNQGLAQGQAAGTATGRLPVPAKTRGLHHRGHVRAPHEGQAVR